jgi:hypothetical protein
MTANVPGIAGAEVPHATATEARAVALALISHIEAVTRSQLLADGIDAFLASPGLE